MKQRPQIEMRGSKQAHSSKREEPDTVRALFGLKALNCKRQFVDRLAFWHLIADKKHAWH
jgi:hypothetical protein